MKLNKGDLIKVWNETVEVVLKFNENHNEITSFFVKGNDEFKTGEITEYSLGNNLRSAIKILARKTKI